MQKITGKEFGRLTARAVFFQSALIMVEILFLLGLLIFLQIKRYDETIALFVAIAILLAAWVFHFAALNKYVKHIRATAELSRLAEEKDIAIVPVKQIRQKRISCQKLWDDRRDFFRLVAPLCWQDTDRNMLIMGQAAYRSISQHRREGLLIADYAVRDDLIELDGMLCTVPGFMDYLHLLFTHTRLKPPVSYKKGPAENGFI